jgi:hypothetical protein
MVVVWCAVIASVSHFELWLYFVWMYAVPTFVAGNLQSWRKYIEHVGMMGSTVNSSTRSIVANDWLGRIVSFTLLPHAELPGLASSLDPAEPEERHPFPNYRAALIDLLRSLRDPRVGAQWRTDEGRS